MTQRKLLIIQSILAVIALIIGIKFILFYFSNPEMTAMELLTTKWKPLTAVFILAIISQILTIKYHVNSKTI